MPLWVNAELLEVYQKRKVLDKCKSKAFLMDIWKFLETGKNFGNKRKQKNSK